MLALAEVTPTNIAERESAAVAMDAINEDLFIRQNYRLFSGCAIEPRPIKNK
jgi:hypothetical protein